MGGVAGGMAHLYNDPSLSFNDIKKILSAASRGEIEGTEKTDGYNIYLGRLVTIFFRGSLILDLAEDSKC